jgi:hypothetical protein
MTIKLTNIRATGNGLGGIYISGDPSRIEIHNADLEGNGGDGLKIETPPEAPINRDRKHWHENPVGIVSLSLLAAAIAAICGAVVKHLGLWPF